VASELIGWTVLTQYVVEYKGRIHVYGLAGVSLHRNFAGYFIRVEDLRDPEHGREYAVKGDPLEAWVMMAEEEPTRAMAAKVMGAMAR
jgi:hypothetical protein